MTLAQLEQRLSTLEAEVKRLRRVAAQPNKADPKWVLAHAGRFESGPGFDEIVWLGREYRESLRTKKEK